MRDNEQKYKVVLSVPTYFERSDCIMKKHGFCP